MYLLWAKWTPWKLARLKLWGQRAAHWAINALSFDVSHTEDMASQGWNTALSYRRHVPLPPFFLPNLGKRGAPGEGRKVGTGVKEVKALCNFGSRYNATTIGCCHHCRWTPIGLWPPTDSKQPFIFVSPIDSVPLLLAEHLCGWRKPGYATPKYTSLI